MGDAFCPECRQALDESATKPAEPAHAEIVGTEGMTNEEVLHELHNGAKFVVYQYCISILVITLYRSSEVHFIRSHESAVLRGMKYTLLSLLAGWWAIPFGPVCTIAAIVINLCGGRNVTPTSGMMDALHHAPG
jgi:hypothetical protein